MKKRNTENKNVLETWPVTFVWTDAKIIGCKDLDQKDEAILFEVLF